MVCTFLYTSLVLHVIYANIQYRIPTSSVKDGVLIMHVTRCIMDAGWGRKPSTIKNHMLEVNINVINCKYIRKSPSYTYLGPHPAKDMLVMFLAVDMLIQSLYLGRLSAFSQLDTVSRYRSDLSTVYKVSIKGVLLGDSFLGGHMINTVLSKCITQFIWFDSL